LVTAISSVLVATPCQAQSTEDVRCLLLSNEVAQRATAPAQKKAAESGAWFFLGRIDGRWNDAQLRAAVAEQQKTLKTIKAEKAGPEMLACMRRVDASYKTLHGLAMRSPPKR